jgi:hypothetical protein
MLLITLVALMFGQLPQYGIPLERMPLGTGEPAPTAPTILVKRPGTTDARMVERLLRPRGLISR